MKVNLFKICLPQSDNSNTILFQRALWSDMFTGRLKTEIPDALVCITETSFLF